MDPDQTAPIGAVCSGSTLFASIFNSSVMLGIYLQQTTSADDIFRCIFFLGPVRVKLQQKVHHPTTLIFNYFVLFDYFKSFSFFQFCMKRPEYLVGNCIQNFHLGRYIVGYTVGYLVLRRRASGAVKLNFRPYIRRYTCPSENFEYGYPHSKALL